VQYGLESGKYNKSKEGKVSQYTYYNYTSGYIHHARIDNLKVGCGSPIFLLLLLLPED
jgi:hypothetical protein